MTKKAPAIPPHAIKESEQGIQTASRAPLLNTGHTGPCPICQEADTMVTTNNLSHSLATPTGVREITRLPGAECRVCGTKEFDPGALAIIEEHKGNALWADYETRVSKSGKVPAILIKEDLRRILDLAPGDRVNWKVIDRDHAYVEIRRVRPKAT